MRSGVRRTIVPLTVGKRRREGCQRPSGNSSCGPTTPARGWVSANSARSSTASGRGSVSGFATTTNGALVAAMPLFAFAAKPSGSLVDDQARVDVGRGRVGDDDELVDLRRERGEAAIELRMRPVRDDDGVDAGAHSSSR